MITDSLTIDLCGDDLSARPIKFMQFVVVFVKEHCLPTPIPPSGTSTLRGSLSKVVNSSGKEQQSFDLPLHRSTELSRRLHLQAEEFINVVRCLDSAGRTQAATYRVFDFLEERLFIGEFEFCNSLLDRVEVDKCSASVMRAFLVITAPAKAKLSSRASFFVRVKEAMVRLEGDEITERLIGDLG
jgi:hypothetical protein